MSMTIEPISQMPGTSLEDLSEVAAGMRDYIGQANAESRQAALEAANRRGLWQRMFPTQFERERQRIGVQNLRQLSDSRRELLEVYTRTQIEIARKRADALIAAQGMHMQTELTRFANEKITLLNTAVNEGRERFLNAMAPQLDMIEQFRGRPELYEPAYKSVNQQIKVYFESTDMLLNGFAQSLSARVGQVRQ